jgi:SOS response regulatory protein OraA/RecX
VSPEQIAAALESIDSESEFAVALELAQRKVASLSRFDEETQRRRIHGALARRGFGFGIISQVMKEIAL